MLYVRGECPFCDQGMVGFRRCSDGVMIILLCDECEALWLDPARRTVDDLLWPSPPYAQIPGSPHSMFGGRSGWATRDEVERAGWQDYIAGEGEGYYK